MFKLKNRYFWKTLPLNCCFHLFVPFAHLSCLWSFDFAHHTVFSHKGRKNWKWNDRTAGRPPDWRGWTRCSLSGLDRPAKLSARFLAASLKARSPGAANKKDCIFLAPIDLPHVFSRQEKAVSRFLKEELERTPLCCPWFLMSNILTQLTTAALVLFCCANNSVNLATSWGQDSIIYTLQWITMLFTVKNLWGKRPMPLYRLQFMILRSV